MDELDKIVEVVRRQLTLELGREPTEKELVAKLPVFVCKDGSCSSIG